METQIRIGDKVDIIFGNSERLLHMTVNYMPCRTGDARHLTDREGVITYVQQYESIMLVERSE